MKKSLINKNHGKKMPKSSAPADQEGSLTAEEYGSQSPNMNDTPGIYGNPFGK